MKTYKLAGCGTALVTPFINGDVDYQAYTRLVRAQLDAGIHFLVALGSTAETPCLDDDEKQRLLSITKELAAGKTVVAGVGTNSLRQTVRNMELLKEADMYLVVVPYYNKPTQRGLYEYFKAVAESTDKPILLYNVPGRTGTNMTAQTTLRLAEIDNVIGIKEASGNLAQIRNIIADMPEGFSVFSGNDDQTLDLMLAGGHGVISVASNIAPAMLVRVVEEAQRGNFREASSVFKKMLPLFDACFVESNPIPVKAGLASMGMMTDEMRLPLTSAEQSTCDLMSKCIRDLNL